MRCRRRKGRDLRRPADRLRETLLQAQTRLRKGAGLERKALRNLGPKDPLNPPLDILHNHLIWGQDGHCLPGTVFHLILPREGVWLKIKGPRVMGQGEVKPGEEPDPYGMRRVESLCTPSSCDPSIPVPPLLQWQVHRQKLQIPHIIVMFGSWKFIGEKGAGMNLMNFRGVLGKNGSDPHYEVSTATMNWSFGLGIHRTGNEENLDRSMQNAS